ncbi:GLOBIN domain-containing protein [Caenorhabditis elegans]|uniref:GLOBIN domain-containing protein n=1 Tax=Caenorhabditis elegans TaxID=6239 RepID=C6KRL2_CAEEL|nr:GLOBIN domain-containing protein [Caenorhabditis elegans]CAZ65487.1 GLOBIN domain-containing protein [Caenorhabditis elegans]|eukprot:NP_001257244.1 Uncharacterized protein CELE_F23D12.11 [Caenorhabditis elegans]
MIQKSLQDFLTVPKTEEKIRQLVALATEVPLKDVGITFSWKEVLDEQQQEEFNIFIANVLTSYFKVNTKPCDIEELEYFWEIVNRITCNH